MNSMIGWADALDLSHTVESALARLCEISAVLTAIDQGELLCDLPAGPAARARHATGACLLAILRRELSALIAEIHTLAPENDAAHAPHRQNTDN
jgi:hypothetical protein